MQKAAEPFVDDVGVEFRLCIEIGHAGALGAARRVPAGNGGNHGPAVRRALHLPAAVRPNGERAGRTL
jgi:hypothetical protein